MGFFYKKLASVDFSTLEYKNTPIFEKINTPFFKYDLPVRNEFDGDTTPSLYLNNSHATVLYLHNYPKNLYMAYAESSSGANPPLP